MEQYLKTHPGSQKSHERARKLFAADGATHVNRVYEPFRPYIVCAKGSRKWDVDGNEYIDYVMGHGSLILGHSHPAVVEAVQEQMAKGVHYSENHELEIHWAELIKRMMPGMERIEFFSCGQEANLMAIRLARVFTGKKKILRFAENFHGWANELDAIGSPGTIAPEVKVIPGHDLNLLEKELGTNQYALLMTEGGGAHMGGQIPWEASFIRTLPSLTRKHSTIWLIDEVVTGFRDAPGGWQSVVGVTPDLTSLGKTVGGGLGVGILGGRADIMDLLNPKKTPAERLINHSGTWNANPLTASAGIAACKRYLDGTVHQKVNQLGAYVINKGNQAIKERKLSCRFYGRSITHLYIGPIDFEPSDTNFPPTKDVKKILAGNEIKLRLSLLMMQRGIATPRMRFFIMSSAHTEEDIDWTIQALGESLDAMIAEGSIKPTL
jgi:glutamate-1-semialdehyde 2,1-aminomutase